ncbi:MAG: asparagine synthase (glutamine-hydrolyzing) [Gemmatimonadetes bacterium]|nr:asparagine synthase (glutamine-hydrolyzing) [Gemmatimonadota bacterium]
MCGIAGFIGRAPGREGGAELREMCDAIVHRGPDEAGYLTRPESGLALGMRRLSIIDLAGGSQPIGNEDGSVQVVFNGEIYNYRELRAGLEKRGHRFSTHTDTEVLVHLYEERGDALVDELRGMFAFALWDESRERLLIARDRLGIKPLYYWNSPDGALAFGSELKSLLRLADFPREIDGSAIADYLALGYVPEPGCIYRGVSKLLPGHLLVRSSDGSVQTSRYWNPLDRGEVRMEKEEAVREIRRLLTESVRYRLIADVPLGAFLSGGLDSSAVVAEMARQMDRPVKTFSIGFEEPEFNEAPHAAAVARTLGTEHTELIVRPDVEELFESIVLGFDEPFADSSAIPTLLVSRLAAKHVKVVLSGDGGDELFAGYTRYRDMQTRGGVLPAPLRKLLGSAVRRLPHGMLGRNRLLEYTRSERGRYTGMVAHPLAVADGGVARSDLAASGHSPDQLLDRWYDQVSHRSEEEQPPLVDLLSYLPGDILTKVDRMSMAASIEARVPLLDHHMVEFATSIPMELKLREGTGKWIFREAIRGLVPDSVFEKRKQGFGVPLKPWLRRELKHRVDRLLAPGIALHEWVEPAAVARVVAEHQAGRRDHSPLLWKLIVLQLWLQESRGGTAPNTTLPLVVSSAESEHTYS